MDFTLEKSINTTESFLTEISKYPVIGSVAGVAKVIMGIAQVIMGVSLAVFSYISKSKDMPMERATMHMGHGVGNVIAGIIETIPVIQTIAYLARYVLMKGTTNKDVYIHNDQETKIMQYACLYHLEMSIRGNKSELVNSVKDKLRAKNIPDSDPLRQFNAANELIAQYTRMKESANQMRNI